MITRSHVCAREQAILHKITNKVEGVKQQINLGRNVLLQDATVDLESMRAER
jgi:hypothetical protein